MTKKKQSTEAAVREMKRNYNWLGAIPYLAALIACAPLRGRVSR
jgi:hypothetical protein